MNLKIHKLLNVEVLMSFVSKISRFLKDKAPCLLDQDGL